MTIEKRTCGNRVELYLAGRLDTVTAPLLEDALRDCLDGADSLLLDLEQLEYLSSAGLRLILAARKRMQDQGSMMLRNTPENILEILTATGFADILTIL